MRILLDLRLFSTPYAHRGIGVWTRTILEAVASNGPIVELFVWGNESDLPSVMRQLPHKTIPWTGGDWRSDMYVIPFICIQHRISVIFHGVSLGPILSIGLGLPFFARRIPVVFDTAVETWNTPIAHARKNTRFWKIQKLFASRATFIVCISETTRRDLIALFPGFSKKIFPAYMPIRSPLPSPADSPRHRNPFFIALGGAPHKNLAATIAAFERFHQKFPDFSLSVAGHCEPDELPASLPPWLTRISMNAYPEALTHATGLLMFSLYEGLGIPVLEALSAGCPVAASDIPSIREIGGNDISYADPTDSNSMCQAIEAIASNADHFEKNAVHAIRSWGMKSQNTGKMIWRIFSSGSPD